MHNRKWLTIGLMVSVAVNLALAGFLVGHMSRPGPVPAMLDPSLSLFRVVRDFPDQRREVFRSTLRGHFSAMRGDLRRMRKAQHAINQALQQEPFDPPALEQALGDFRAALLDGQQGNHRILVDVAADMTPQERLALRDAMVRGRGPYAHERRPRHSPREER